MNPAKLNDLKKELLNLDSKALVEICLRVAKYKKENKELVNYLLFNAEEPLEYAELVKSSLLEEFENLSKHYYYSIKSLRKVLRAMNRHIKYTGSKEVEIEITIWFCDNFLRYADTKSGQKPLRAIFVRQMERISKVLPKLHEDLQFDYQIELDKLQEIAAVKMKNEKLLNFL